MIRLKLNLLLLFISSLFTNSESFDGMFLLDCHHFPHYTVHFFILWDLSNSAFQPIDPLIPSTFPHFVVRRTALNSSYLTDSYIVFTLKMESVSKITIFGLKMMVKSGLEKIFLKFLHAEAIFF